MACDGDGHYVFRNVDILRCAAQIEHRYRGHGLTGSIIAVYRFLGLAAGDFGQMTDNNEFNNTVPQIEVRRKKILYRAEHRGTKELDFLLGKFARASLETMSEQTLENFEQLLALPEPEVERMIMVPENATRHPFYELIHDLRRFHGLD